MHGLDSLILDLTLILVAAAVITVVFKKLKQPVVLGYIVVGILISPNFKYLPTPVSLEDINVWATIGIVFLMFALGLEFSFHKIAKVGGSAVITAGTVMTAMILIGFALGKAMGWSTMNCVFLGAMISMSSTMIILKSYDEMDLKSNKFAQVVLGSLVIEDIAGIFLMIVLTTVSVSSTVSGVALAKELVVLLLALVVILCAGIYVVPTLLNKVKELLNKEMMLIISLGFCMLMVFISTEIGFSEALGAFLAGSILAGTSFAEEIEEMVQPIKDLFGAIFFVSVGMMVDPPMLVEYAVPILIIIAVTIAGQMLFSMTGAFLSGQQIQTSVRVGFSMVQVGEFSFIIAALGVSLGVMDDFLYQIIVFVSVFTIFFTPMFIKTGAKAAEALPKKLPSKWLDALNSYTEGKGESSNFDEDWKSFIKSCTIKIIVCVAVMFMIYQGGIKYVLPYVHENINDSAVISCLIAFLLIVLMAPFINILCRKRSVLFNKLWMKDPINKIPLMLIRGLCVFISAIIVMAVIREVVIDIPVWIEFILALLIVVMFAKSDFMKGRTMNLEARFIANFNDKVLKMKKLERENSDGYHHILEEIYAVDFQMKGREGLKTINDFNGSRAFGITIVQIIRKNGEYVNVIKANTHVHEGDIITAVGSQERVEAYIMMLEQKQHEIIKSSLIETLAEHIYTQIYNEVKPENRLVCMEIPVGKKMSFYRKPIKSNRFREKYKGSIIGVERNHLPILNPSPDFVLSEGDIIWAIGTQVMVDEIMRAKIVTEE